MIYFRAVQGKMQRKMLFFISSDLMTQPVFVRGVDTQSGWSFVFKICQK